MRNIVRQTLAVLAIFLVLAASFFAWFYIELDFDGCCGAPSNFSNDGLQLLTHLGAYAVAAGLMWLAIIWGWKKPKSK